MYKYQTKGVCPRNISYEITDNKIHNVKFSGGCDGNLKAIAKLVEGKEPKEVVSLLKGIDCQNRGTSCGDQLSKAIEENQK